ncbi:hypothetical protein [Sandaracinus amylolyticus]|uniref:hypothetical protein n=1 Tax=Sandaracinus amylolyticus TaxID=927083 RepID=UPI001F3B0F43|nr:hypothetical protein [Sandaracinus amylolyticus]UJR86280.1 Hypothetical protein I5071_83640 [Sandaracinus amylolyticus]
MTRAIAIVLASLALIACGDDDGDVTDAGAIDASRPDASSVDAARIDAGVIDDAAIDAGPPSDPEEPPRTLALEGDPDGTLGAHGVVSGTWGFDGDVDGFDVVLPETGPFVLYAWLQSLTTDGIERDVSLALSSGGETIGATEQRVGGGATIAIARRVGAARTVRIAVSSDRAAPSSPPYRLEVVLLSEADEGELDDATTPRRVIAVAAAPWSTTIPFSRVNHQGDVDSVRVDVPAHPSPQVLRVAVRTASAPPWRVVSLRGEQILRVLVGGWSDAATCRARCPRDASASAALLAEIDAACEQRQCLVARRVDRDEAEEHASFETVIPLAPASATTSVTITHDAGDAAVDSTSEIALSLVDDPDEAARLSGGVEQPTAATMAYDASAASYPEPGAGSTTLEGALTYGHGAREGAVRGPSDYDAMPSDVDTYHLQLPSVPPGEGLSWMLAWDVEDGAASGSAPGELAIGVTFCDGDELTGDGACTPVGTYSSGAPITLAFDATDTLWTRVDAATSTRTIAAAAQCSCIEPRFVRGGTLRLAVRALERATTEPIEYVVRTALTTYPRASCPSPCAYTDR